MEVIGNVYGCVVVLLFASPEKRLLVPCRNICWKGYVMTWLGTLSCSVVGDDCWKRLLGRLFLLSDEENVG